VKQCGGDGKVRLLDDAGRFNPGHGRCYGALAEVVRDIDALVDNAGSCCSCVRDACGGSEDKCVAGVSEGRAPEASSSCLAGACASQCAQAQALSAMRAGAARKP
jgi:hypothetical protein